MTELLSDNSSISDFLISILALSFSFSFFLFFLSYYTLYLNNCDKYPIILHLLLSCFIHHSILATLFHQICQHFPDIPIIHILPHFQQLPTIHQQSSDLVRQPILILFYHIVLLECSVVISYSLFVLLLIDELAIHAQIRQNVHHAFEVIFEVAHNVHVLVYRTVFRMSRIDCFLTLLASLRVQQNGTAEVVKIQLAINRLNRSKDLLWT